jgi:hypothetical protein
MGGVSGTMGVRPIERAIRARHIDADGVFHTFPWRRRR